MDEGFAVIYIDNVLEHLDDPMRVMEDDHRIYKVVGQVKVIVPHFRSLYAFIDPTHEHYFSVDSFAFYEPDHIICQRFDYVEVSSKVERIVLNETLETRGAKRLTVALENKWQDRYERY